jgi:hypothetical protein
MAALVVGCGVGGEAPTTSLLPDTPLLGTFAPAGGTPQTAQAERLEVCKRYQNTVAPIPASTSFDFSSVADPAKNQSFSITSAANDVYACREIWLDGGAGGNVTVTEPAIAGYRTFVTRMENNSGVVTTPVNNVETNTATGLVRGGPSTGQLFLFTNVEEVREDGCTLTQGYWKTHSLNGPAPYDDAWLNIGASGANTLFYTSGLTWYQLFWTPPKGGNAYIQLAHQYMAAKLNILAGASTTPAVDAAITGAEAFFAAVAGPNTTLTAQQKSDAKAWASTLGSYNEGDIGPGHCQDSAPT